jgi:hypothetical protein
MREMREKLFMPKALFPMPHAVMGLNLFCVVRSQSLPTQLDRTISLVNAIIRVKIAAIIRIKLLTASP